MNFHLETCLEKVEVDMVLVVDESSSVDGHFSNVKQFVKYLVNKYTISDDSYNIGIVRFAETTNTDAKLGEFVFLYYSSVELFTYSVCNQFLVSRRSHWRPKESCASVRMCVRPEISLSPFIQLF